MTDTKVSPTSRPLRTQDATRERVPLPPSDSPAWADPATVWRIATYAERTVDPDAHALAHPVPAPGCPFGGCVGNTRPFRDRGAETTWREDADRPTAAGVA